MPSEKVWLRFEGKKHDGTVLKLRIQDVPSTRKNDIIDMMLKMYTRDEPVHKALDVVNNPKVVESYGKLLEEFFNDSTLSVVVCCTDDTDEVKDILGASIMTCSAHEEEFWDELKKVVEEVGEEAMTKLYDIFYDCATNFDAKKIYGLDSFYDDRALIVHPEYRGLGIAKQFIKVRRIMCEAHGVQMTGAWVTAYATQKAAARDGWETVSEIKYDDLAKKYDINFTDVPPTMKFMVAKPNTKNT